VKIWTRLEQWFKRSGLRFLELSIGLAPKGAGDFDACAVRRILIVRQHDQLGDFLLSTPVFRALRSRFPKAFIAIVSRSYTASLAKNNEYLDHVISFHEHGMKWTPGRLVNFVVQIRKNYDLAVVLNTVSHSLTSDLIARMSRAPFILGSEHLIFPNTSRNFFYNLIAPFRDENRHQTERNLDIVRYIEADTADLGENMRLTDEEIGAARGELERMGRNPAKPLIAIHPGAGKAGNRWPVTRFATVGRKMMRESGVQLFVTWGPEEALLGGELLQKLNMPVLHTTTPDLRKLAAYLSHARLLLCNDTGVMHLAAAVGTPLVAVFGPTDPAQWKPLGEKFVALRAKDHAPESVEPGLVYQTTRHLLNAGS
jgi:ADP-heptose:LPS heptosyltransferase